MITPINHLLASDLVRERAAVASHASTAADAPLAPVALADPPLAIRLSRTADAPSLWRLGRLDGDGARAERLAALADGGALVADVDGETVAALALDGTGQAADPFRPTLEVSQLLQLRASQLAAARRAPKLGFPARLRGLVH